MLSFKRASRVISKEWMKKNAIFWRKVTSGQANRLKKLIDNLREIVSALGINSEWLHNNLTLIFEHKNTVRSLGATIAHSWIIARLCDLSKNGLSYHHCGEYIDIQVQAWDQSIVQTKSC